MTVEITWQSIITAGAVLGALGTITAFIVKGVRWFDKQKKQDADIKKQKTKHDDDIKALHEKHDADMAELRADIKTEFADQRSEMQLIIQGVLASLKGLSEQGCNGPVTEAIKTLDEYLNQKAHDREVNI
jgi:hypothetical protein